MTGMTPTHPPTDLTLASSGIDTAKKIMAALVVQRRDQQQRDDYGLPQDDTAVGTLHCNRAEQLWRKQGRTVLSMHPGLTAEVRLATSTKIEPEVFRALPYLDPLVVYPGGVELPSWKGEGESIRLLGFFAHGRSGKYLQLSKTASPEQAAKTFDEQVRITSTHNPEATRFGLVVVNEVTTATGAVVHEYNRVGIPLHRADTLAEHIDRTLDSYGWSDNTIGRGVPPEGVASRAQFMRDQLATVLGTVMYLCSTVLDTEMVPKTRIKRAWGDQKTPTLINVGWRIGPALTARRYEAEAAPEATPTGRTLPPHQRRAHFKTVWTGQGRTVPKTVFIAPYWVHKELIGLSATKTVKAVS